MRKRHSLGIILCLLATNSHAEIFTQTDKLDQVRSNIDAVKKKMQQIMLRQNDLNDQLAEIENRYGETAASLRALKKQIEQKHKELNEIRQDIQDYRSQIARHGKELSAHIRAAYAMGRQDKLKLILNRQDPVLANRILVYHGFLNKIRLKELAEFEDAVRRLGSLNQRQQQEAKLLELDLGHKKQEQAVLDQFRWQRNELLKRLSNDFSSNEQRLSQLVESEAKLKGLIDELQTKEINSDDGSNQADNFPEPGEEPGASNEHAPGESFRQNDKAMASLDFSSLKGKLPWPVKGKIASRIDSEQVETIRDGVLINAGEGTEIQAVSSGKVVYSEWLRGYGLLMIIDHGQGYMTLYAFNQSLYKRVGDWVRAGEVIASVGQSGGRSHSGLYFGIRKDSKPIDPLEWCPKSSRG